MRLPGRSATSGQHRHRSIPERLAGISQNLVSIFLAELSAEDSLGIAFLALEHGVGDLAVLVQIDGIEVGQDVLTDHLALHMTSFGSVSTDEASGLVIIQSGNVRAVLADGTVEEDNRDVACSVDDGLSHIGIAGGNNVNHQQIAAASNSGTDLLQLLSLILTGKLVVVVDAGTLQGSVQFCTNSAKINVSLIIPEDGNLQFATACAAAGNQSLRPWPVQG